jgi:hypothetical protein
LRLPVDPQHFNLGAGRFDSLEQFGSRRSLSRAEFRTDQQPFRLVERLR